MKKILLLMVVLLYVITIANAQNKKDGIIECNGLTKEQIWNNVKKWQSKPTKDFNSTIDSEDKDAGIIVLKLSKKPAYFNRVSDLNVYSKLRIEIKDEKCRYSYFEGKYTFDVKDLSVSSYLPKSTLLSYQKELKALERLAKDEKIPDDLEMSINVYSSMLNKQPKYKKPKDEKKGKVNPYWEDLNETVETAKRINTEYELMIGDVQMSLLHGVLKSDDF